MLLILEEARQVTLSTLNSYADSDGKKWFKVGISMLLNDGRIAPALAKTVNFMRANSSAECITLDETMENINLEFFPVGAQNSSNARIFRSVILSHFSLSKEKNSKAGTIDKEFSGRLVLEFKTTVAMFEAGMWALENYAGDVMMIIGKAQPELPMEPVADNPDSQEARNERIEEDEKRDEVAAPADAPKARGRKKKEAGN